LTFYPFLFQLQGIFANGTQVAVKQLFTKSQQSLDVFLNEIVLVAAVKHRNLVKLKGCCIRKDQRLLVHEYVELGDLEQVLFGMFLLQKITLGGRNAFSFPTVLFIFSASSC
jgi:hypothetical protein